MSFSLRQNINFFKCFIGIKAPLYIQYAVTNSCNLSCSMCNSTLSRKRERELSLDEIKVVAKRLKVLGSGIIILSGGEPLLRKDIVEIVRIFKRQGMSVRMQSNGFLMTEPLLQKLKKAGLDGITISLHSLDKEKSDYITGTSNSLLKIIRALSLYDSVFPENSSVKGINTLVSAINLDEVPKIIEFTDRLNFSISLIPVHSKNEGDFIVRKTSSEHSFRKTGESKIETLFRQILGLKKRGYKIYNSEKFLENCPAFIIENRVNWSCHSPDLYFSVSPSGKFLPCVDLPGEYSLLDKNFLVDYRKGKIKASVKEVVSKCSGCMYVCYPEFSWMYESRGFFIKRYLEFRKLRASGKIRLSEKYIFNILEELNNMKHMIGQS